VLLFGAANHDPAAFNEPHRLLVDRAPNAHVGFSMGIHYCLGAHLARLEAQIVLGAVIRRLPRLALRGGPLEWRSNRRVRGLKSLPVRF
jgi:cytochrome P450